MTYEEAYGLVGKIMKQERESYKREAPEQPEEYAPSPKRQKQESSSSSSSAQPAVPVPGSGDTQLQEALERSSQTAQEEADLRQAQEQKQETPATEKQKKTLRALGYFEVDLSYDEAQKIIDQEMAVFHDAN